MGPPPSSEESSQSISSESSPSSRMNRLTLVLQEKLGPNAPTGDAFIMALGSLCGYNPSTHYIDIIGIKDRRIPHSWHQDSGRSITHTTSPTSDETNDVH